MKTKNVIKLLTVIILISVFTYFSIFGLSIGGKTYIKSAKNIKTGLDISGGVSITYQAVNENADITLDDLKKSEAIIRRRLEKVNIYDYFIRLDDATDQLYIEIPTNSSNKDADPLEAVKGLDKTAKIEFKDTEGNVLLSGDDIKKASYSNAPVDSTGIPAPHVVLEFSEEGTKKFAAATEKLIGKQMPITLDSQVITDPYVDEKIESNTAIIRMGSKGTFEEREALAKEYAMLIDSGALPFSLNVVNKEYIGAYVGQQALEVSVKAGLIAVACIALFMIIAYRLPGIISSISLVAYVAILLFIMVITGTSLTLPGIAGLILSIGMAVDANVIIFERLKEELRNKIPYKKAFERSFKTAMATIIDGNITTLIVAVLLYLFGIGPVKGFGLVLAIGVLVSLFTAVVITKFLLKQILPLAEKVPFLFGMKKEVK